MFMRIAGQAVYRSERHREEGHNEYHASEQFISSSRIAFSRHRCRGSCSWEFARPSTGIGFGPAALLAQPAGERLLRGFTRSFVLFFLACQRLTGARWSASLREFRKPSCPWFSGRLGPDRNGSSLARLFCIRGAPGRLAGEPAIAGGSATCSRQRSFTAHGSCFCGMDVFALAVPQGSLHKIGPSRSWRWRFTRSLTAMP